MLASLEKVAFIVELAGLPETEICLGADFPDYRLIFEINLRQVPASGQGFPDLNPGQTEIILG